MGDSTHVEGFQCPVKKFQCKACHSLDSLPVFVTKRSKHPSSHVDQRHINSIQGGVYVQDKAMCRYSEDYSSSDDSFCLQIQVQCTQASSKKIPTPTHIIN